MLEIILILGFFGNSGFDLPLDEVFVPQLQTCSTMQDRSLILSPYFKVGSGPKVYIYVYDHKSGKVREVEDGRIKTSFESQAVVHEGQFIIVDPFTRAVTVLSNVGEFVRTEILSDYTGFDSSKRLGFLYHLTDGKLLSTQRDREQTTYDAIAIDLKTKSFEMLFSKNSEERIYWIPSGEGFFELQNWTGKLFSVDIHFQHARLLLDVGKEDRDAIGIGPLLVSPLILKDRISFIKNTFRDVNGLLDIPKKYAIFIDGQKISRKNTKIPLVKTESRTLVYDLEEQELIHLSK